MALNWHLRNRDRRNRHAVEGPLFGFNWASYAMELWGLHVEGELLMAATLPAEAYGG